MADEYKLWKVTYDYRASHIDGDSPENNSYVVVATSQVEALNKADSCFSYSGLNKDLLANGEAHSAGIKLHDLRRHASEVIKSIPFPVLHLDSDVENFDIQARIRNDGQTLEFIVLKK